MMMEQVSSCRRLWSSWCSNEGSGPESALVLQENSVNYRYQQEGLEYVFQVPWLTAVHTVILSKSVIYA